MLLRRGILRDAGDIDLQRCELDRYLDPAASFVVIAFMIFNIYEMLTNSLGSLLDQAIGEAGQLRILKALTRCFDDFEELGDIRTRSHGGRMMVELHLGFDPAWSVERARDAVADLTLKVKEEFAEVGTRWMSRWCLCPRRRARSPGPSPRTPPDQWSDSVTSSDHSPGTSLTIACPQMTRAFIGSRSAWARHRAASPC